MPTPSWESKDTYGPYKDRLSSQSTSYLNRLLLLLMISTLSITTWNVRGLTKDFKREELVYDAKRYGFDFISLQETKCRECAEIDLIDGYKLILFGQNNDHGQHGIGFLVSPKFIDSVLDWNSISDRVAYINFRLTSRNGTYTYFRLINAYGPTMQNVRDSEVDSSGDSNIVSDMFYADLRTALEGVPAHYEVFIAGDFNSRLGRRTDCDIMSGLSCHIGRYGVGGRNSNGKCLLDFMIDQNFYACNTSFKHPARHTTTWHGTTTARGNPDKTVKYYKQIDFILCRPKYKVNATDSRSYGGALLTSDHKPVVARFVLNRKYLVHKKHKTKKKLDIGRLHDPIVEQNMLLQFEELARSRTRTMNPNEDLNNLMADAYKCAESTLGTIPPQKHKDFSSDPEVSAMSHERKSLIISNTQNKDPTDRREVKRRINQLKRGIRKRLKEIKNNTADNLIQEINTTDDMRRYYGASKILAKGYERSALTVTNASGNQAGCDAEKARIIKEYFNNELNDDNEPTLPAFLDPPSSLDCPITTEEVQKAIKKLKSGKAVGIDNVPGEVIKALNQTLLPEELAKAFNESFEKNIHIEAIGAGILTPLAKPGKPRGPVKSIRPLTLLNVSRKILSLVVLNRIEHAVDNYTGSFQAAYKAGRSCADLVWAQNMMISVVMRKEFEFSKVSLDMSAAFNTIRRGTTINLLEDAGCSRDDMRLVQYLMANTTLTVRVNSTDSEVFSYNIGASQGDSAAGKLFTLNMAGGIRHVRAVLSSRPNPPIADNHMPMESGYSDDIMNMDEDMDKLQEVFQVSKTILRDWSLFVNDKTSFTRVYLAEKDDVDEWGNDVRGSEGWRNDVVLGTKLGSEEDIINRINKANTAFRSYDKLWRQGPKRSQISEERKLKLYESLVVSVQLYNCCCWSAPKRVLDSVDVAQRKHLRRLLNIFWPQTISNDALYERCKMRPLTEKIEKARWTMLGHVLRSDNNTPAYQSFLFAAFGCAGMKGRRGRHRSNLFDLIVKKDLLIKRNIVLNDLDDFYNLVNLAKDRIGWRNLFLVRHIGRRSLRNLK